MREERFDCERPRPNVLFQLGRDIVAIWRAVGSNRVGRAHRDRMTRATMRDWRRTFLAVLGPSGTRDLIEPRLRCLVAHHLGVDTHELGSRVSLREDLAADSLDLLELALVLEREFAISVPDRILDGVLSYGDLVDTTVDLVLERARAQRGNAEQPPRFWAQLLPPENVSGGTLACAGLLTPYTAETLARDARMAGAGARLDIMVASGTTDVDFARVSGRFAPLAARGVRVNVRRHDRAAAVDPAVAGEPPAATA